MKQLKEYKTSDGFWTCDIDISVNEWYHLLWDKDLDDKVYIPVLLKIYREPGHRAACKNLEKKYGQTFNYYRNAVTNFGKWVQKKLGTFEIIDDSGAKRYWPTAVYGTADDGLFDWIIRPELAEAIEMYLIERLLREYKKVVIPRGLRDKNNYEIYKWEIIARCNGSTPEKILSELVGPACNLIDKRFDGAAIKQLLKTDNEELQACFEELTKSDFKESYPVFKKRIDELTKGRWKYVISDERMASAYLACANPQNYTFYKSDIYSYFCQYLGIETKPAGRKYEHYLSLLPLLVNAEEKDEELQSFISQETEGMIQSKLLAAQDILWQMQVFMAEDVNSSETIFTWVPFVKEFAEKLLPFKDKRDELLELFYGIDPELVKAYQENDQQIDDVTPFTVLGTLAVGGTDRRSQFAEYYKKQLGINSAIPTDYTGFPSLHPQRVMFIYGAGKAAHTDCFWDLFEKVMGNEDSSTSFDEVMKVKGVNRNISMGLFWIAPDRFLSLDGTNEEYLKHYGLPKIPPKNKINYEFYSSLMKEVSDRMAAGSIKEHNYLEFSAAAYEYGTNNIENNTSIDMANPFYKEISDALKEKKNVILQGAPGTGKTYAIPEVVTRLCGEDIDFSDRTQVMESYNRLVDEKRIVFTTFHQSMEYEDFVEGLKPEVDDSGNLQYKVQNGIFKTLCKEAAAPVIKNNQIELGDNPTIWKVSLAGTGDNEVRSDCHKNGYIRIGWDAYGPEPDEQTNYSDGGKGIIDTFINKMEIGDIAMSCYSNRLIDAIGVITGNYEWHDEFSGYKRVREVKWLVKGIREDISALNGRVMTLGTVYRLNNIKVEDVLNILKKYNAAGETTAEANEKPYVIVIDEINRGNVAKIFGELITLLEADKREKGGMPLKVKLPYSKEDFSIPSNVYLLATMNTADRSLSQFDYAMRRRFRFITMTYGCVDINLPDELEFNEELFRKVSGLFISNFDEFEADRNAKLKPADCFSVEFNPADLWPGQSMFIVKADEGKDLYNKIMYEIIPTLEQYEQDSVFTDTEVVDTVITELKESALSEA